MSVDLASLGNFPFWKGDTEKSRLRRETEDVQNLQLRLKKQKELLAQIRSGKVKVPDGGARVEGRITELEATVGRLARSVEQKEDEGRSEQSSMRRQGSRGRDLRNLEEQLASRLLRGFGSPNVGVADVKEKIDPFPDGKRSSSWKAATASCRLANHASEDVGTTVSGQQSSGRVNESRRARDRLAEPADIQQASGSHQGDLARERRALEKMIEDDARRVSVTDAQPAMMSDSSSSLGDGGSSANLECEETGGMSTLRKAAGERDATTGREAQRRLASSAKGNAGSCDDQAPRPIRAYPLVGKAGGGMCWLRNGVLEPIGGRLSREAIRATRARMRKELAEEASKEADRLAILLKISEDEEEERSILQDPKFSSKESVSDATETPDVKRLFDERFNIRCARMISIQEAGELLKTQEEYQMDVRDELISRRPPIHKQLGHKLPPMEKTTATVRDPNRRPGSAPVWAHRGRDEEECSSSDELSAEEDEREDEDGDDDENEDD